VFVGSQPVTNFTLFKVNICLKKIKTLEFQPTKSFLQLFTSDIYTTADSEQLGGVTV